MQYTTQKKITKGVPLVLMITDDVDNDRATKKVMDMQVGRLHSYHTKCGLVHRHLTLVANPVLIPADPILTDRPYPGTSL